MIRADAPGLGRMPAAGFPMAVDAGEIRWYSPDPRGIIPLDTFHDPARLARAVRGSGRFEIDVDSSFGAVIRACAAAERDPDDPGTGSTTRSSRATARCTSAGSRTRSKRGRTAAGRRALRRRAGRRVFRRVDVPPRDRRVEGRARRARRSPARARLRAARHAVGRRRTSSSSAPSRFRAAAT